MSLLKSLTASFAALVMIVSGSSFLKPEASTSLTVSIVTLRSDKGHVLLSLFKESDGFPDKNDKAFRNEKLVISNNTASVTFDNLLPGTYAISMMHDENDDQKMNKNWVGIPKEGYGFSNNVTGTFGPPSFGKASFIVSEGKRTRVEIKTKY